MLVQFIASRIANNICVAIKMGPQGPIFILNSMQEMKMFTAKMNRIGLSLSLIVFVAACAENEIKKADMAKPETAKAAMAPAKPLSASAAAGKAKADAVCAACHGANGYSQLPNAPHLAGQPEIYVKEQLKAYRNGKRAHEVMAVIAKPLTDDEINNLAAWYSSIEIKVGQGQ
jgi:cytochrome c553